MKLARRILVADDHPDSAWVLAALLRADGHTVHVAGNGATAIEKAATLDELDLAFLDLRLADMDGCDVAREIRRLHGAAVLVAVTGLEGDDVRDRCRESGFDSHVRKPILDFGAIRNLVDTLVVATAIRL